MTFSKDDFSIMCSFGVSFCPDLLISLTDCLQVLDPLFNDLKLCLLLHLTLILHFMGIPCFICHWKSAIIKFNERVSCFGTNPFPTWVLSASLLTDARVAFEVRTAFPRDILQLAGCVISAVCSTSNSRSKANEGQHR